MNKQKKIAVVGGGAAGMMAAGHAAELGADVILFERNMQLGRKLGITGKGRCNLTNDCTPDVCIKNMTANGKFLYSALYSFPPEETKTFFEKRGVPLKTERGNRVFPVSDRAADIVSALKSYCIGGGVIIRNERVTALLRRPDGMLSGVRTEKKEYTDFDAVILCTGGVSYPGTGSTGDGYRMAQSLGHTINEPIPSLVGLCSDTPICKAAQGLSLKNIAITVLDNETGKTIYRDFGEMLFAHYGVSGPVILSASAHMRPMKCGKYTVFIDLKPALDESTLDRRLLSDFAKYQNKNFENALCDLLPAKLQMPFPALCGIAPDRKVHSITHEERARLREMLKALPVVIAGFRPIAEAIVTSGGVSVKEVLPQSMRSRLCPNLYFAGEILDVDAYTGGFNLQIAFATARTAARAAAGNSPSSQE